MTELRERAGSSRSELARKIDVSQAYLAMLENSTYQNPESPSLEVLRQLYHSLSKARQILGICKTLLVPVQNLTLAKTNKDFPKTISLPSGRFDLVFSK